MTFGRLLQLFILVPLCGALAVPLTTCVNWGYWWSPPGIEGLTDQIASLDRFTTFYSAEPFVPMVDARSGSKGLQLAARAQDALLEAIAAGTTRGRFVGTGCDPMPSLGRALVARRLEPTSDDVILDARLVEAVCVVKDEGYFDEDEAGGPLISPIAHLAEGRSASGEQLLVAAISSFQVSNDRYDYCEALFRVGADDALTLVDAQDFSYDCAGMEGDMHLFVGGVVTAILLVTWLMCAFTLALRATVLWIIRVLVPPRGRSTAAPPRAP